MARFQKSPSGFGQAANPEGVHAHGCLACPHPATGLFRDDDGPASLLPASNLAVDGGSLGLRFEPLRAADLASPEAIGSPDELDLEFDA
jgi:hypothetical protein